MWKFRKVNGEKTQTEKKRFWSWKKIIGIGVILIIAGLYLITSFATVNQGHALLIIDLGTNSIGNPIIGPAGGLLANGFSRIMGLQQLVDIYYETDKVEMWTTWKEQHNADGSTTWAEDQRGEYPAITTLSKDGLSIEVDILVRWSLDPNGLKELYQKYPNRNWKDIAISSIIREKVREAVSVYSAIEVIEKRQLITETITNAVVNGMKEDALISRVVQNLVVDLRNIDPSMDFVAAVGRKLSAEQAQLQANFEYERALTLARAEADSKVIVANGTRQAIESIISMSGESNSTRITELYMYLENLKTIAPNVKLLIVNTGGGSTPIIYPLQETSP